MRSARLRDDDGSSLSTCCWCRTRTGTASGTARSRRSAPGSSTPSTGCSTSSPRTRAGRSCSTASRSWWRTTSRCGPTAGPTWSRRCATGGSRSGPGTCSRTRCCRRASRWCATCWRAAGWRSRSARARRSPTCPTRSGTRRSSRSSSPASGWDRSSTGAATATSSTACGPIYRWVAPDGSERARVPPRARLLRRRGAAARPRHGGRRPARRAGPPRPRSTRAPVLLMNGIDHMLPDDHTGAVADALARRTGLDVRARSPRRSRRCHRPGGPRRATAVSSSARAPPTSCRACGRRGST